MHEDKCAAERRRPAFPRTRARCRSHGGDDRGAAVVEAALTLPLVLMLIFGMITGGVALAQQNSIQNAAREASRFGATLEVTTSTNAWLDDVADVAIGAATGELDPGAPGRYLCVALVGTSNGSDGRKIIDGGTTTYGSGACPDMSCPIGSPCVHVALQRDGYLDLIFATHDLTLEATGVTTFERN